MSLREWRQWMGQLPWMLRWFVILVLLRPVIDTLYFLKEISPLISPLNIVGVLTPVLIVVALISDRTPRSLSSKLDYPLAWWGAFVVFNAIAVLSIGLSQSALQAVFKMITPVLIYFFARRLIRSRRDLHGVLTTLLISTAIPFAMMVYEFFVNPLDSTLVFTRGYVRASGLYADVMSYGSYFITAFFITGYFYIRSEGTKSYRRWLFRLAVVVSLCVLGLIHIHHTSSWGVATALLIVLGYHTLGSKNIKAFIILFLMTVGVAFFAKDTISERLSAALETEIAVLEGREGQQRAFHGRMMRWTHYLDDWEERGLASKLLGISVASRRLEGAMLFGIHNDYLRIMFATGIIGLVLYLFFYLSLLVRSLILADNGDRFLIRGAAAIMLLYSVTLLPTTYSTLLYLCFSVFAYGALPQLKVRPSFSRPRLVPRRTRLRARSQTLTPSRL